MMMLIWAGVSTPVASSSNLGQSSLFIQFPVTCFNSPGCMRWKLEWRHQSMLSCNQLLCCEGGRSKVRMPRGRKLSLLLMMGPRAPLGMLAPSSLSSTAFLLSSVLASSLLILNLCSSRFALCCSINRLCCPLSWILFNLSSLLFIIVYLAILSSFSLLLMAASFSISSFLFCF
jgi:hypothetical protein